MSIETLIINVDGASRGNPGPAAVGITLKDEHSQLVAAISQKIGITTNNQAEYKAIIAALKKALSLGAKRIFVKSDSELMVRQMQGSYRVKKAELIPLHREAGRLSGCFESFTLVSIPREENREADKLANLALDSN
jgi:ribonuclease HI